MTLTTSPYQLESYTSFLDAEPIMTTVYQDEYTVTLVTQDGTRLTMERCPRVMSAVTYVRKNLKRMMTNDGVSQDAAILEILVGNGLYRQEIDISVE